MDEFLNLLSKNPPPIVSWLTTALATILVTLQIWEYWRKRGRLDFHVFTAQHYLVELTEEDVRKWDYFNPPAVGEPREVFTVIEFTITNRHTRTITLGRANVDGWMFEESYQRSMYDRARDYRVFDLHTNERTSLADYGALAPGAEAAFRIEAYEHCGSHIGYKGAPNRFKTMRARIPMEVPRKMTVELHTSDGRKKFRFKLNSKTLFDAHLLYGIYRMSGDELMPEEYIGAATTGLDAPQGVNRVYYRRREPVSEKLKGWYVRYSQRLRNLLESRS